VLLGHIPFLYFNFTICLTFWGNKILITVRVPTSSSLPSVRMQSGKINRYSGAYSSRPGTEISCV
jgi:hypothetical protein